MKDADKLAATVEDLAKTVADLSRAVARLEKINARGVEREVAAERHIERDRRLTAISRIPDDAERARAIAALPSIEDVRYALGECDAAAVLATLEAADANARIKLRGALTPEREMEVAVARLPAPRRVRARINPNGGATRIATPPIPGHRKSDRYPGFSLDDLAESWVELERDWRRRLEIDEDLAEHVERGAVLVEPVSEEESKRMLYQEVISRPPEQRPRLTFEGAPDPAGAAATR